QPTDAEVRVVLELEDVRRVAGTHQSLHRELILELLVGDGVVLGQRVVHIKANVPAPSGARAASARRRPPRRAKHAATHLMSSSSRFRFTKLRDLVGRLYVTGRSFSWTAT